MSDDSSEVDEIKQAAYGLVYGIVVVFWLAATAVFDVTALVVWEKGVADVLDDVRRHSLYSNLEELAEGVVVFLGAPLMWMFYVVTLLVGSPLIERVLHSLRDAMVSITPTPDADLSALSPGLRGLVADSRVLRAALEQGDDATLREVWDWQRRFEALGESDRRELEHHGLADPGIADLLRWTVAEPERTWRGLTSIYQTLEQFEHRLLDPASLFRGPFR